MMPADRTRARLAWDRESSAHGPDPGPHDPGRAHDPAPRHPGPLRASGDPLPMRAAPGGGPDLHRPLPPQRSALEPAPLDPVGSVRPARVRPYADPDYRAAVAALKAHPVPCVDGCGRIADSIDHDPPLALHDHRRGTG